MSVRWGRHFTPGQWPHLIDRLRGRKQRGALHFITPPNPDGTVVFATYTLPAAVTINVRCRPPAFRGGSPIAAAACAA